MSKVFIATKKALAKATLLAHPRHGVPLSLTTDASDLAVGAVLQQHTNSFWATGIFQQKATTLRNVV